MTKSKQKTMIEVKVRLYAGLSKYSPGAGTDEVIALPISENTRLSDLVTQLGLLREKVKLTFVNQRQQDDNYHLQDGDQVAIFLLVAGG